MVVLNYYKIMKQYLPWVLVAVALIGGYLLYAMYMPAGNTATIVLAELNGSGIYGSARLAEANGNVTVTLTMNGGAAGVAMPAHIHEGVCPGVGAVKHPLESVANGSSVTTLSGVTLESLKAGLPLAINVHKSAEEMSNYVACGAVNL